MKERLINMTFKIFHTRKYSVRLRDRVKIFASLYE